MKKLFDISFVLILIFVVISIVFSNLISTINSNAFKTYFGTNLLSHSFTPQGWSFFTRNPQENRYQFFKLSGSNLELVVLQNSSIQSSFGLSRNFRKVYFDLTNLVLKYPDSYWIKSKGLQKISCFTSVDTFQVISRLTPGQYICIRSKPIPWEWSQKFQERYVPIESLCFTLTDEFIR